MLTGTVAALGVTAVELMPVHQFVHDGVLQDRGLAPHARTVVTVRSALVR